MTTTNFVDGQTVIEASWLNDVDEAVYNPPSVILPATSVTTTAISGITATDVQGVLAEIVAEKAALVHVHAGTDITSGAVAIANGGTGQTTAALAFTALKQAASDTATGVVEMATAAEAPDRTKTAVVLSPATLRDALVAQNDAPIYACRAWINFNGVTGAVNSAGNATVTKNGTGDYTVTFTTAMPDANYAVTACGQLDQAGGVAYSAIGVYRGATGQQAGSVRIGTSSTTPGAIDYTTVSIAIFR